MNLKLEKEDLLIASNYCNSVDVGRPNLDAVTLEFNERYGLGDENASARKGATAVAAVCLGANKQLSGWRAIHGTEDKGENSVVLYFEDPKEETVAAMFGRLEVGDEYVHQDGTHCVVVFAAGHKQECPLKGPKAWRITEMGSATEVRKIIRKAKETTESILIADTAGPGVPFD